MGITFHEILMIHEKIQFSSQKNGLSEQIRVWDPGHGRKKKGFLQDLLHQRNV